MMVEIPGLIAVRFLKKIDLFFSVTKDVADFFFKNANVK